MATTSSDFKKLQGTWHLVSMTSDGQEMGGMPEEASIVIKGNQFTSIGMGGTYEGTVAINQKTTPRSLTLTFTKGHATGTRNFGIYKLSGETWTLCLATRGDKPPKTFVSKPDSGVVVEVLRREASAGRKAPKTAKSITPSVPASAEASARQAAIGAGAATPWEGEWAMVRGVFSGAEMADAMVQWAKRVTQGDVTSVVAGPQVILRARFTLDPSAKPAAVDYVNLTGSNKGKLQAGIFEIKDDVLSVCMSAPGGKRPSDFSSAKGDGRSLTTWRRL